MRCLIFPVALVFVSVFHNLSAQPVDLPVGSVETIATPSEIGIFKLPIGEYSAGEMPTRTIEGRISKAAYRIPLDRNDMFSVFSSIRDALAEIGYATLFQCTSASCGGFDFRYGIDVLPPPEMEVDLTSYHFASLEKLGEAPAHITLLVSRNQTFGFIQIIEITPDISPPLQLEALPEPAPNETLAPSVWSEALLSSGKAVLDEIKFEPGQARLTEESTQTLEAFASFMADNAELSFLIVGHSDNTGSLEANIGLSKGRAEAVRQKLISDFGVSAERLTSAGAGFMAPRARNSTEEGRASNRRVEVVLR